ncbi:uncharacterized protein LOC126734639 [Anthonomus grandis grandis]|uniref:uncharacterized protein LOC126734639 n=1 Tax=Anthonomus grandis grandis TaxID=2921223 RepID=UPI002165E496|nr:uncharacterized protein LOC126734639 [Anthonomus grandis grandis]
MVDRRVWSRDDTNLLIENVELYPELWNVHCKDFKNRVKKQGAFQKLAELFETSENEIQRKLHNLKTQLNQEWKKIQKKKSGQGANEVYKSPWEFFDSLKFMLAANVQSCTEDNLTQKDKDILTQNSTIDERQKIETETKSTPSKKPKKIKVTEEDAMLANAVKVMNRPSDNWQILGDYVASELRSLCSEQRQLRLKKMIQRDILTISELADSGHSTPASIPLLSPTYDSSASSSTQYTVQPYTDKTIYTASTIAAQHSGTILAIVHTGIRYKYIREW